MLNANQTHPTIRPAQVFAALLLALLSAWAAAAIPASYQFNGVGDTLAEDVFIGSDMQVGYADHVLGVASAINNNDFLVGFWLTNDGHFRTFSAQFRANPRGTTQITEGFIAVSGSDVHCIRFLGIELCPSPEYPYGTRILDSLDPTQPPTVQSAFVNTPLDATAIANSLPFMRYPGNFVDENAAGILASTQLGIGTQHGVLLREVEELIDGVRVRRSLQIPLTDVPWLVAINDLPEPLIIGYDGNDGGCLVYGEGCLPELTPCEIDPNQGNTGGSSGREASGHAWGHDKCKDGVTDGNNGGGGTGDGSGDGSGSGGTGTGGTGDDSGFGNTLVGALLLHLKDDNTVVRYRFPTTVPVGTEIVEASKIIPLAINKNRVILRGDVLIGTTLLEKRLLSCAFNTVPDAEGVIVYDADADFVVDCSGGLQLVGGVQNSIRIGTVLGFTLNNENFLAGNFGYNAAGIGMPMVVDLTQVVPVAELVGNLAGGTEGWEINTITDMNDSGRMSGYGYKDCGRTPEAFFITPLTTQPGAGVRFQRGAFEHPAWLEPGGVLTLMPTMTGGSGAYEVRVHVKKPDDPEWALLSDWALNPGSWSAGDYQGDVCFRIEARDPSATAAQNQQIVVRYSVGVSPPVERAPDDDTGTGLLTPTQGDFEVGDLLTGSAGTFMLMLLAVAGLMRQGRRRR